MKPFDILNSPVSGLNVIEASAGTGKTYTIEGVFIRLLIEKELSIKNILVVTFTEAATSELKERIREKIRLAYQVFDQGYEKVFGESENNDEFIRELVQKNTTDQQANLKLETALAEFDDASIFTIHGFCQRMLMDYAFESQSRFDTELIRDQRDLLSEIGMDFWRERFYTGSEDLADFVVKYYDSPQKFSDPLTRLLSKPVKRIITGLKHTETDRYVESARESFDRLADAWEASREAIRDILLNHPGIKHNPYNKKNVPNWIKKLDDYFSTPELFPYPECLVKFSATHIHKYRNDKADLPSHPIFDQCDILNSVIGSIGISLKKEFIDFAQQALEEKKDQLNINYFDDLLKRFHKSLHGKSGDQLVTSIRKQYHIALIDEFQDTDPIQYEIFKRIFAINDPQLFYIGDPKQSIYNFRGADIFAYLDAQKDAENKYNLGTNWRSDGDLIKAVNTIFDWTPQPFLHQDIQFNPTAAADKNQDRSFYLENTPPPPFNIWYINDDDNELSIKDAKAKTAKSVADEVTRLINLGTQKKASLFSEKTGAREYIQPHHITILVRTHSEADLVQQKLREVAVPSVINTKASIFASEEFEEIAHVLYAIVNFNREQAVKKALITSLFEINGNELYELTEDENKWEKTIEKFRAYHELWNQSGFYSMVQAFLNREQLRHRIISRVNGERKLTNLLQVWELFHEAENRNKLGMAGLMKWAENAKEGKEDQDENQLRLETDDAALQILTIHASKGLEFPIVFCPFLWKESAVKEVFFHDEKQKHQLTLDLGSSELESHKRVAQKEQLAESIRLLYVALTRAKHLCYLAWGKIKGTEGSALTTLFHDGQLKDRDLFNDLENLANHSGGTIQVSRLLDIEEDKFHPPKTDSEALQCLNFNRSLRLDWGVSSFSAFSRKKAHDFNPQTAELPDRDRINPQITPISTDTLKSDQSDMLNAFTLPGSAKTGNCFHEIMEELDFQETNPKRIKTQVEKSLFKYDIDEKWMDTAITMVDHTLKVPITTKHDPNRFCLQDISWQNRKSEMEFYFPLKYISTKELKKTIESTISDFKSHRLYQTIERLDLNENQGFMKGFIDLTFCHQERYYLLDWKTNTLGNNPEAYHPDKIETYMIDHAFVLQYYIYSMALHKMLQLKLKEYSFDKHFGGVFYFFLRGLDKNADQSFGIFHDDLSMEGPMIEKLTDFFSSKN